MKDRLVLATRKSALAMAQAELTKDYLENYFSIQCEFLPITTTGDRKKNWSLEQKGGKGLFTKELEEVLLSGEADIAVHSAKDLPTAFELGLSIAAYLPREEVADVLVLRSGCKEPTTIATNSPRRRTQAKKMFPSAVWTDIRGNVETRLKKIAEGKADATFLAAAGLNRLGIKEWEGLEFVPVDITKIVPAVGQGAIALQVKDEALKNDLLPFSHQDTHHAVELERAFLHAMGGGCHAAFAVHYLKDQILLFHEAFGYHTFSIMKDQVLDAQFVQECLEKIKTIAS